MWNTTEMLVELSIKYLFSAYELQTWVPVAEIRESNKEFQSLKGERKWTCKCKSQPVRFECYGILLHAMPASRNNVIYEYLLLSSDLCKTSWMFLHGPVCPKTGPILSRNVVRFVLKAGPFCPGTWSVLSWDVVRFVLERGPFCLVRFAHGPFCRSTLKNPLMPCVCILYDDKLFLLKSINKVLFCCIYFCCFFFGQAKQTVNQFWHLFT